MDDEDQFWSVVSDLEPRFAEEAAYIIGTFEAIKERLISRFSASHEKRLKTAVGRGREEIGSRTPSRFLRYLQRRCSAGIAGEPRNRGFLGTVAAVEHKSEIAELNQTIRDMQKQLEKLASRSPSRALSRIREGSHSLENGGAEKGIMLVSRVRKSGAQMRQPCAFPGNAAAPLDTATNDITRFGRLFIADRRTNVSFYKLGQMYPRKRPKGNGINSPTNYTPLTRQYIPIHGTL